MIPPPTQVFKEVLCHRLEMIYQKCNLEILPVTTKGGGGGVVSFGAESEPLMRMRMWINFQSVIAPLVTSNFFVREIPLCAEKEEWVPFLL